MAATVVSVVIFLCGVLVGRGVRAERGTAVAEASEVSTSDASETTPASPPSAAASASTPLAGSDPRAATPPPAADELSYFDRLEKNGPAKEDLKAASEKPKTGADKPSSDKAAADRTASANAASTSKAAPPPKETPAPPKSAADSGDFAVQVAALNARGEADAIARRLTSKGYAAYVGPPGNGAAMFRVRVGHFKTRHDAEPVFAKLQKEEQFKPWITR